jgi:hypothetical protein
MIPEITSSRNLRRIIIGKENKFFEGCDNDESAILATERLQCISV